MKKHLLYLFLIAIGIAGCKKQHPMPPPQNITGLRGKYVMYMKIDTFYNYTSPTQYTLNVTHETLTGDTLYLNSGTPNQAIQPSPIAGYDPAKVLADTLVFLNDNSGTRNVPGDGIGFKYNIPLKSYVEVPVPGISNHIIKIGANSVEVATQVIDVDGGVSDSNGWYYKKL
jgi:hypothetical protein